MHTHPSERAKRKDKIINAARKCVKPPQITSKRKVHARPGDEIEKSIDGIMPDAASAEHDLIAISSPHSFSYVPQLTAHSDPPSAVHSTLISHNSDNSGAARATLIAAVPTCLEASLTALSPLRVLISQHLAPLRNSKPAVWIQFTRPKSAAPKRSKRGV